MISLLILPFILQERIQEKADEPRFHTMQVNMPNEKDTSAYGFNRRSMPYRRYKEIYLTGDDDENKVLQGQLIVRQWMAARDTVDGLKFVYTNKTTYATYVATLNLCWEENVYCYGHFDDSLLIVIIPDQWTRADAEPEPPHPL